MTQDKVNAKRVFHIREEHVIDVKGRFLPISILSNTSMPCRTILENFVNDVFNENELDARIQGLHEEEKPITRSEDEEDRARMDLD